jgi:hypothetical protein
MMTIAPALLQSTWASEMDVKSSWWTQLFKYNGDQRAGSQNMAAVRVEH